NEARAESDRANNRILLVGNQAVNILHDLKSLASAPQIYSDLLLQNPETTDPRLVKALQNLQRDLGVMVKKTQALYQIVQRNENVSNEGTAAEELESALSFLKNRLKEVEVVISGSTNAKFPKGALEIIFLNLFY